MFRVWHTSGPTSGIAMCNDRCPKCSVEIEPYDSVEIGPPQPPERKEETMTDETETIRRQMVATINAEPGSRADLESKHGQVWDTSELSEDFQVLGFAAPLVIVRRRSDRCARIVDVSASPEVLLLVPTGVIEARMDGSVEDDTSTDPSTLARSVGTPLSQNRNGEFQRKSLDWVPSPRPPGD